MGNDQTGAAGGDVTRPQLSDQRATEVSSRPIKTMPGVFSIANHGSRISEGSGQSAVSLAGFARRNHPERPHGVVNDFVASQLGLLIGVPVPPTALVNLGDSTGVVALMFGENGLRPPAADLARLARDDPWSASGIKSLSISGH